MSSDTYNDNKGCGVGGKISTSDFPKFPTPTFPKCPILTPQHKGNEIWLLKLLQPLRWRCAERMIHHERDMREEQHPYICCANKQ